MSVYILYAVSNVSIDVPRDPYAIVHRSLEKVMSND